jgi:hypothetical protein
VFLSLKTIGNKMLLDDYISLNVWILVCVAYDILYETFL